MSRSVKKTPIAGIAGISDKWYKRKENRRRRRKEKIVLAENPEDPFVGEKLFGDAWDSSKDGKFYFGDTSSDSRKKWYDKLIRK